MPYATNPNKNASWGSNYVLYSRCASVSHVWFSELWETLTSLAERCCRVEVSQSNFFKLLFLKWQSEGKSIMIMTRSRKMVHRDEFLISLPWQESYFSGPWLDGC